jgi:hypothetical protein
VDIYDEQSAASSELEDGQAADDRIAEQFRRDFMDAIQNRSNAKKPPPTGPNARGAKVEDKSKGPKLGGSRSARAAMHAMEKAGKKK